MSQIELYRPLRYVLTYNPILPFTFLADLTLFLLLGVEGANFLHLVPLNKLYIHTYQVKTYPIPHASFTCYQMHCI
jgi:hypothetical protein